MLFEVPLGIIDLQICKVHDIEDHLDMSFVDKLLDLCKIKSRVWLTWHLRRIAFIDPSAQVWSAFAVPLTSSAVSMEARDCT